MIQENIKSFSGEQVKYCYCITKIKYVELYLLSNAGG